MYADDATLYSYCDQAVDLWQQLECASELLNLNMTYETLDWGRKFQYWKNAASFIWLV